MDGARARRGRRSGRRGRRAPGAAPQLRASVGDGGVATAIVCSPVPTMAPSSSGLGHHPLMGAARVRIPMGLLMGYAADSLKSATAAGEDSKPTDALAGLRAN